MSKPLKLFILFIIIIIGVGPELKAQVPSPAPSQSQPIAIMNGTAHLGNGKVIDNSIITFRDGKIETVANATVVRVDLTGYRQIDASGKHVYPGLILPLTTLGLVEVDAVRATRDFAETGELNPNVRAIIAYNTDSELIPTMKFTGIQLAQVTPKGGARIPGSSSVVQLDAWNWEDAAYKTDDGIHLNWPLRTFDPRWWIGETERRENKEYNKQIEEVRKLLRDTQSYMELSDPDPVNLKLEAMKGVFTGEKRLYVNVNRANDIIEAVSVLKEFGIPKIVLAGARDAWYVKDFIKENNIPVLLDNVHRLPGRDREDVDLPYKLAALLTKEGILVGLSHKSDMVNRSRNLPFFAGTVAAYGLGKEEALKLVTSNTAQILGIDHKTGTLEEGKDANIVISTGDLLDMRTNNVEYSFIQGREVELKALQQRLYKKYKEKYKSQ